METPKTVQTTISMDKFLDKRASLQNSSGRKGKQLSELFRFIDQKRTNRKHILQKLDCSPKSVLKPRDIGKSLDKLSINNVHPTLEKDSQEHRSRYQEIQKYQLFKRKLKLKSNLFNAKFNVAFYKQLASPGRGNKSSRFISLQSKSNNSPRGEASTSPFARKFIPIHNQSAKLTLENHYKHLAFSEKPQRNRFRA